MDYNICLGTVQLGQHYGINNALGRKPHLEESFRLLNAAIDRGIRYFDTASVYGDAESILGSFGINRFDVRIISKLRSELPSDSSVVISELRQSIERLGVKSLHGYLLHSAEDFYRPEILRGLKSAKELGLTQNIGVSIYEPEDALRAVKDVDIDIIQIPYNVLDQRLDQTNFFELAEKNKVSVFARSAFLQGLLLMESKNLPPNLRAANLLVEQFQRIAREHDFSPSEAAMLYSYCHEKIDFVLFGVETQNQLENNLRALDRANEFGDCFKELHGKFRNVDRKIIVPSLWKE